MILSKNTHKSLALAVLAIALVASWPSEGAASLVVSSWSLLTFTEDASVDLPVDDFVSFTEVQSPFQAVANTAVGPNTASTAYDFSWSGDSGSFDITTTQRAETFRVRTISSGLIFFAPTADLRMTINASLDYASPPGDLADVFFRMAVVDEANTNVPLFFEFLEGGNLTLQPAVGTLAFSGDVILPAGATYGIQFIARNDNGSDNNPTGPITSSGFFHFNFQPIPEPATAWLMAFGVIALRRQKRICRRR